MSTAITHVQPGSIAQRLGLVAGDKLVSIAGEPIIDQIDYQALTAQERFDMMVEDAGGQTRIHFRENLYSFPPPTATPAMMNLLRKR